MEYCLGDGDGSATMWTAQPDIDADGDGALDAVGLDFDGDGLLDDAMADLDGDGFADHLVRDHAAAAAYFTDDGTGTWAVSVDRTGLRWFGLDGVEHTRRARGRSRCRRSGRRSTAQTSTATGWPIVW